MGLTAIGVGRGVGSFQKYQEGFACERSVVVACQFQRLNWVGLLASFRPVFFSNLQSSKPNNWCIRRRNVPPWAVVSYNVLCKLYVSKAIFI
jgi:hypothetical protein